MDTRVLSIVAVVVAAISGGYYYYSGKAKKLDIGSAKNMTYSAQGVHLTQTDDQGNLYIRAEVRQLEQDMQQKHQSWINLMPRCIKMAKLMRHSLQNRQMVMMITVKLFYRVMWSQLNWRHKGRLNSKLMS